MKLKAWKPWTFLLPALLIYLVVIVIPSLYTLQLSLYETERNFSQENVCRAAKLYLSINGGYGIRNRVKK